MKLEDVLYDAWNRADHCVQLLLNCGAGEGSRLEKKLPDAETMRRLLDSAERLQMHVGDLARLARGGAR